MTTFMSHAALEPRDLTLTKKNSHENLQKVGQFVNDQMFNEFNKHSSGVNSSTNSTQDISDCHSPGTKFNCDEQVAKVTPFVPTRSVAYQPQAGFNSALFFNVDITNTLQVNGQEDVPELNEADMLGNDLMDALDEDVEPSTTFQGRLQLNQNSAPFIPTRAVPEFTQEMNNFEPIYIQQQPLPMFTPMNPSKVWKPVEKDENSFRFPDGGWECSKCQNYNFKGRKNCHRCKKSRCDDDQEGKPQHMNLPVCEKAAIKLANKAQKRLNRLKAAADGLNPEEEKRGGDWICQSCFNHNYSFRSTCNKCQLSLQESEQMLQTYVEGAKFLNQRIQLN